MSIGKNIKKARGQVRQSELAEKIGVDVATVSRWENDKNTPNGHMMQEIAKALNTTVSYLSGENEQHCYSPQTHNVEHNCSAITPLTQLATYKNNNPEETITVGGQNNMYIIKDGEREFCFPDNDNGRKLFLDIMLSSLKGIGLRETSPEIKQEINNGTNSSYNNSTVLDGSTTVTQVEMSETA